MKFNCLLLLSDRTADDDHYASENSAQGVRSPVLGDLPSFDGPRRIAKSDINGLASWSANDVIRLTGMVFKDALVVGKVESVFIPKGDNKLILNLGPDFRNCFKVVIDVRDFEKWGTTDPKRIAKMFDGFELAVDGLISLHQSKPQIVVALPHQLRIFELATNF